MTADSSVFLRQRGAKQQLLNNKLYMLLYQKWIIPLNRNSTKVTPNVHTSTSHNNNGLSSLPYEASSHTDLLLNTLVNLTQLNLYIAYLQNGSTTGYDTLPTITLIDPAPLLLLSLLCYYSVSKKCYYFLISPNEGICRAYLPDLIHSIHSIRD